MRWDRDMMDRESLDLWTTIVASMRLSRADVFGPADEQLPISEILDAHLPQIGFVGANYRKGGDILLGINPGGGGDAYHRTLADTLLLPMIESAIRTEPSETTLRGIFQRYAENMRTWNLWRIVEPVLEACGRQQQDIVYLNWCPFRTRADRMPRTAAMSHCRNMHIEPLIKVLAPARLIALGMKVGSWVEKEGFSGVQSFTVPRTIGDTYVSPAAAKVLVTLRKRAIQ
jgi:hypothetical protein